MNINRVTIAGFAGKDARTSSTQNGKSISKLSVATTKRYKASDGSWQEKTQWHAAVAYGPTAEYAAKIQTGCHVCIEGEMGHRECGSSVETDNGPVKVMWPVTEIVIESVTELDKKEKNERK